MPKHYKEMIDEIINKMDEQKESNLRYSVKFAYKKGGKIAINLFQLYEFCRLQIIDAFRYDKNDGLKKSYDALSQIVSAWDTMEK